ncbi:vitamin K epoxide reductase family protein [Oxynema aestuarii]|uniref:Vitamin K epoxide reductase family protein n=1 Tax=Oxynema aestuarii AP17 TaxID=2064643 RepID=A0A6H1U1Y9_9CYAN|nr:vitamin K epoxide reductase family protein [Oxynema aestuarii]QIZ72888.1 vitamin K epoxide reductase family protein [Oxynema aestuarii AP17]RMH78667.1 MAG: hypothetical protein D6680_01585 [Cyanobacteria bacterium J007]
MIRRRSTPWIHRKSRFLIAAIATMGAVVTAYLTVIKLMGDSATCPTSGCDEVLNSPYATVFGFPLTLFGLVAYVGMTGFAVGPFAVDPAENKELRSRLEDWTWWLILVGGTSMAIFSGYLMYLLAYKIQALCIYCLASALFSLTLFVLAWMGKDWEDIGQAIFTSLAVGMVTIVGTLGMYASINSPNANSSSPFNIVNSSGPAEIALAEHLSELDAKMYGGFLCPHCHEQKELFGKEATEKLEYIECDYRAPDPQVELCQQVGITGYPTWEINDKLYPGRRSLEELAKLSDYSGPRNFQNTIGQ